jgi:glucose-6-phosphate isomerase
MQLEYFNCPAPQALHPDTLPEPAKFLSYIPDFEKIGEVATKYKQYKNLLIIGHGGSITSFHGIYTALHEKATKKAYILSTLDPDYIFELKQELNPEDTLVIAISKSGETTTQVEALMHFTGYPLLVIAGADTPLAHIGQKLQAEIVEHPPIGGRYVGFTEVALLPLALCGIDVEVLYKAGRAFHARYQSDNEAWKAASVFWQLEQNGCVDVFMPVYSHNLFGLTHLIVQLCHESFGKQDLGQTYFAHEAPESQHHTNQRFFGGRKNIAGIVLSIDHFKHNEATVVPTQLHSIVFKIQALVTLNKIPLQKGMLFEMQGVIEDAKMKNIPLAHLSITNFDETELGSLMAFWQMYAVYSSVLRQVDPFDQPEVEASKRISFDKRLQYKGVL